MKKILIFLLVVCFVPLWAYPASRFFAQTRSLPRGRQMYGAVVSGDYLYVIGGSRTGEGFTLAVEMAPISENGQLGNWVETTPLPANRSYISNATFALGDYIYVVGGWDGNNDINLKTVLFTHALPDGNLAPWQETIPFPGEGLSCLTAVSSPGYIYILGGFMESDRPTDAVLLGRIGSRGEILDWSQGPPLPKPLWFHNAAAMRGRIWIWGGLPTPQNTTVSSDVYSAPILSTSQIGAWAKEPTQLPTGLYRGACSSTGSFLLTFSTSYAGGEISSDAYFAQITSRGITQWGSLATGIPIKNYLGVAPDFKRNNVYICGGRISKSRDDELDNRVFFFHVYTEADKKPAPEPPKMASVTPQTGISGMIEGIQTTGQTLPGFHSYIEAQGALRRRNQPLICYFHSPRGKKCSEQVSMLTQPPGYSNLLNQAVFVFVDVTHHPQLAQQIGIFRAPAWVFYRKDGVQAFSRDGLITLDQLKNALQSL